MPIPAGGSPGGIGGGLSVEDSACLSRSNAASGNAYRPVWRHERSRNEARSLRIRVDLCGGHAVSVCFKGGLT